MVKCTINGKSVEVKPGTMIIQAFKQLGEDIAHYCWHPALSVAGVCRLCMVEIEGNPRLQIACNTPVAEGMVVNNNSEKVKDAVKWGLDFHLINHPLDCPICDQAGECGLQDQYMKFGKYESEMAENKVKKSKVVDLGERVVLDTERCILCSRCVRFTEEVSKTNELGIFNRGDRSEIGTYANKPLNNNYSVNTVDICPVGALTSKDFRFQQRVWFLKEDASVCNGCSTGCSIYVHHNKEGAWRVKPRFNEENNGYWMCDKGRDLIDNVNPYTKVVEGTRGNKKVKATPVRVMKAQRQKSKSVDFFDTQKSLEQLRSSFEGKKVALVITAQYTQEETSAVVEFFAKKFGPQSVFHWTNAKADIPEFDGLLYRNDRNPNTQGLLKVLAQNQVTQNAKDLNPKNFDSVWVCAPENISVYEDINEKLKLFSQATQVVWLSSVLAKEEVSTELWQIPVKSYLEKSGTFINYQGKEQKVSQVLSLVPDAVDLIEVVTVLKGEALKPKSFNPWSATDRVVNQFVYSAGDL